MGQLTGLVVLEEMARTPFLAIKLFLEIFKNFQPDNCTEISVIKEIKPKNRSIDPFGRPRVDQLPSYF